MTLELRHDADLSTLNTFAVPARARRLATLEAREDIDQAIGLLGEEPRSLVLGAGSNLLFTRDFDGTVLRMRLRGRRLLDTRHEADPSSRQLIEVAAGEDWHELVLWTLSQGLSGLENLALIPGSVGAAPVQNIGAYGVELSKVLHEVEAVNLSTGRTERLSAQQCSLAYRSSIFRRSAASPRWLILSLRLALWRTPQPNLSYADLQREFAGTTAPPSPAEIAAAVIRIRTRKLPDPARLGNAGSFFRNPVIGAEQARQLRSAHPAMPVWPDSALSENMKVPAAWLIEHCGWKGCRRGDAGVHAEHALVLVNHGAATGAEIASLARDIQTSVEETFGIHLDPEVVLI